MKRKTRIIAVVVMLIMAVANLTAGGKSQPSSGASQDIVFMATSGDGPLQEQVAAGYTAKTGANVKFDMYAFDNLFEVIEIKSASHSSDYDALAVDVPMVTSYASRGILKDLNEYFSADEKNQLNDMAVEAGSYRGGFYAVPAMGSSLLLFYNTALLKEAGIVLPADISVEKRLTWEDLQDITRKGMSVIDPNRDKGYHGIEVRQVSRVLYMNVLANSLGGLNIGDDGLTVVGVIDTKPWIDAMNFYQGLVNEGLSSRGIISDEMRNLFVSGKIMFMLDAPSLPAFCDSNNMKDYDCMPVPAFRGHENQVATSCGGWHYGVNAFSQKPAVAADFLKYMTIREGATQWYELYGSMPTLNSLLSSLMNDPNTPNYWKISFYEAGHTAVNRARTPGFNEYQDILNGAWEDVRNGERVEATLMSAVRQLDSALQKYR